MTDEMTVQTKSSVTPMVVGGVLGAGAGVGATFIKPVKNFISEPAKYSNWDAIVAEASDKDKFETTVKDSGIPSDKQTEILDKVEEARTGAQKAVDDAQKAVDDAKKAVDDAKKAVQDKVNPEAEAQKTDAKKASKSKKQSVNYQELLTRDGDKALNMRNFILENKEAENFKEFIKEYRAANKLEGEAKTKALDALASKYESLYSKLKTALEQNISVEDLTDEQKKYLKKHQGTIALQKDQNLQSSVTKYKEAKQTLAEAVSKKENSIKTALEPYKNDLAKLLENGKMHWGKASAVIAGSVALGAIIGSFFRPKNDIA